MALSNSQYNAIMHDYEERQTKNRHLLEERTAYVKEHVEGYRELCDSVSSLSVSYGKKLLDGDETAMEDLKNTISKLSHMKQELLENAGLGADYLTPVYDCPDCKDTGYIGNEKCHCFQQAIINLLYEQSGIQTLLQTENFEHLSYGYYQGEDLLLFQRNVAVAENFVKTFNSDYHNLFFYGTVGTGKSFLSGCIAKALIEKGHSVIYFSAVALFEALSRGMFEHKSPEEFHMLHEELYGCDLLIIDDLGTEFLNNVTASQFFSLMNERHLNRKPTIISTNLFLQDIQKLYSERIFSRIMNHYKSCKFSGPDIRRLKKAAN